MDKVLLHIEKLREQIIYLDYLFEKCSPNEARSLLMRLNGTKEALKAYKELYASDMLKQPANNLKPIPFISMDTWTEELETTLIK